MRIGYSLTDFQKDLTELGLLIEGEDKRVLMTLLDGSFEAWVDHLINTQDVLVDILPQRTIRRTTEIITIFGGGITKISNLRDWAWKDYNGDHFFTEQLLTHADSFETIESQRANFKIFLKLSGLDMLKKRTTDILPAWSVAFIHRMPEQIQSFYFPGV